MNGKNMNEASLNKTAMNQASAELSFRRTLTWNLGMAAITAVAFLVVLVGCGTTASAPVPTPASVRITTLTAQQDVFVSFQNRSLLFASFSTAVPIVQGKSYDYLYGVGIR